MVGSSSKRLFKKVIFFHRPQGARMMIRMLKTVMENIKLRLREKFNRTPSKMFVLQFFSFAFIGRWKVHPAAARSESRPSLQLDIQRQQKKCSRHCLVDKLKAFFSCEHCGVPMLFLNLRPLLLVVSTFYIISRLLHKSAMFYNDNPQKHVCNPFRPFHGPLQFAKCILSLCFNDLSVGPS